VGKSVVNVSCFFLVHELPLVCVFLIRGFLTLEILLLLLLLFFMYFYVDIKDLEISDHGQS
jgi:uncharacterized membrane protein YqaE (UPF0057 family)